MNNNDIIKKLRVALMLRDDQIVDILQLVDFRISKGELGNFFRSADHPKYMECGDQVLRNFLNGLVIYFRGTKENPKIPSVILNKHREDKGSFSNLQQKQKTEGTDKKPSREQKSLQKQKILNAIPFKNGKHKKRS
jgi:hypothetical protein